MTTPKDEQFGALLSAAISYIASCEYKMTANIDEELGDAIGVSRQTIQRYKSGKLPPIDRERDTVCLLAKAIIKRPGGSLSRKWLEDFLRAARCFDPELLDELCPIPITEPKLERVYENLPSPTYSRFVMRQQAFAEVVDGIERRSAVVLISSLGGMGKTSLALEFAKCSLQSESDVPHFDAVVWVSDLDNPGTTNLSVVLDKIAQTLDYPGFTEYEHRKKQNEVEQLLRRQHILLVVDNFETITDGMLLEWLLRVPEPSKAIITTREYRREFRNSAIQVELKGMIDSEAWELINERLEYLRMPTPENHQTQLAPLLEATGGNPKALAITMGLLKYERRPLQQMIDEMYAAQGEIFDDLFRRSWGLLDESAKRVLLVSTFFVDTINREALASTAAVHGPDFEKVIEQLTDLALLDHVQQMNLNSVARYTLHPLVRSFATSQLVKQPEFEREARERWVEWYVEGTQSFVWWKDVHWIKQLSPDIETIDTALTYALQQNTPTYQSHAWQLARITAWYYSKQGPWARNMAIRLQEASIAKALGDTEAEIHALLQYLEIASIRKEFDKAEERIQQIEEKTSNIQLTPSIYVKWQQALALYWYGRGDVAQALTIMRQLQHMDLSTKAGHSPHRRSWNHYLYALYLYESSYIEEAKQLFLDALQEAEDVGYIRGQIFPRIQLATIALDQNQYNDAEQFLHDGQELASHSGDRRLLGPIYRVCTRLHDLRGELTEAHAALTEAIDLFERMGMPNELAEAQEELTRLEAQMTPDTD